MAKNTKTERSIVITNYPETALLRDDVSKIILLNNDGAGILANTLAKNPNQRCELLMDKHDVRYYYHDFIRSVRDKLGKIGIKRDAGFYISFLDSKSKKSYTKNEGKSSKAK